MSLTPNFGFNIPESIDIVNLLTQCYPNFTIADTALQAVKETGVTVATESKAGTVHNLVRNSADCALLWFTATSNYTTGDTFTVDGSPVSAVKVSGAGLETGDFVINSNVLAIVKGSVLTVLTGGGSSQIDAQDVDYDNTGSGLVATNVQDAVDELAARPVTAAGVTYDNTVSGLTATDVQAAIDEVAGNSGAKSLIASATANTSWATQLINLETVFNGLTTEQKLGAVLVSGVGVYQYNGNGRFVKTEVTANVCEIDQLNVLTHTFLRFDSPSSYSNNSSSNNSNTLELYA